MGLCNTCDRRDTCTELCEAAERYVDQDHTTFPAPVFLRDQTVQHPGPLDLTWPEMQGEAPELGAAEWAIVESIQWITARQKECIRLYYWERLSLRDIAAMLDINPVTVMRLVKKAQASLRRYLWAYLRLEEITAPEVAAKRKTGQHFAKFDLRENPRRIPRVDERQTGLFC